MKLELPPLPHNTILLVEVGSTAHGTGIAGGEDLDLAGIVVETKEQVLGVANDFKTVMQRTQPEGSQSGPGDTDRTLYSLRTFLNLASQGNPSILMDFWAPPILTTPEGDALRSIAKSFISRSMVPRYRGYARGQALRLLGLKGHSGHGKRGGGQRTELIEQYGWDTKYAMHCARLGFQCLELLDTDHLELPVQGETGKWLVDLRHGKIDFKEWWDTVLSLDAQMGKWENGYGKIRDKPDFNTINSCSIAIHQGVWDS